MLEKELLVHVGPLSKDDLRKLISQARALADLGPTPDQFADKDARAIVESLFGKPAKKRRKK